MLPEWDHIVLCLLTSSRASLHTCMRHPTFFSSVYHWHRCVVFGMSYPSAFCWGQFCVFHITNGSPLTSWCLVHSRDTMAALGRREESIAFVPRVRFQSIWNARLDSFNLVQGIWAPCKGSEQGNDLDHSLSCRSGDKVESENAYLACIQSPGSHQKQANNEWAQVVAVWLCRNSKCGGSLYWIPFLPL